MRSRLFDYVWTLAVGLGLLVILMARNPRETYRPNARPTPVSHAGLPALPAPDPGR